MKIKISKNQILLILDALNNETLVEEFSVKNKFKKSIIQEIVTLHQKKRNLQPKNFTIIYPFYQLVIIFTILTNYNPSNPLEKSRLTQLIEIFHKAIIS